MKEKAGVPTVLIMRRTANYPPEALHHLGLITRKECQTLSRDDQRHRRWRYYRAEHYS